MADETVNVELGLVAGDTSAVDASNELTKALEAAKKSLAGLGETDTLAALGLDASELAKANAELELAASNARLVERSLIEAQTKLASADFGSQEYERTQQQIAKLTLEYDKYLDKIRETPNALVDQRNELSRQNRYQTADVAGTTATALANTSGLLGGSEIAGTFESILDVTEALPKLGTELAELGAKALQSGDISGKAAAAIGLLPAGFQATAAGALTLLTSLGPLIAVAGTVAGAIAILNKLSSDYAAAEARRAEQMEQTIATIERRAEREQSLEELIAAGDVEGVQAQAAAAQRQREIATRTIADLEAQKAAKQEQLAAIDAQYAALGSSLNIEERNRLREAGDLIRSDIADLETKIGEAVIGELGPAVEDVQAYWDAVAEAQRIADQNAIVDGILREAEARAENARLIEQSSSQEIAARRAEIQARIDTINSILQAISASGVNTEETAAQTRALYEEIGVLQAEERNLSQNVVAAVAAREAETAAIQGQLDAINQRIALEQQAAQLLRDGTSEQVEARLQAIEDERAAIEAQLDTLRNLAQTSEEAAARLAELEDRLGDLDEEAGFLANEVLPQVQLREQAQGLQEVITSIAAAEDKIIQLRTDSANKLTEIESKLLDTVSQIATKRQEAITAENASYFAQSRQDWEDYRDEVLQDEDELREERLRIANDTLSKITAAEQANDIVALARAKAEGAGSIKELEERSSKEAAQRDRDFAREQERAAQQHQERLAQIDAQAVAERERAIAGAQQQSDAERARLDERLAAEEAALAKTLQGIADKYGLEQQLVNDLLAERADRYAADAESYNATLDEQAARKDDDLVQRTKREIEEGAKATSTKAAAEQKAAGETAQRVSAVFVGAINTIQARLAQLQAASSQQGQSSASSSTSSTRTASGGAQQRQRSVTMFANEGVVTRPTEAILGDRLPPGYAEAAVRFKESEGLPASILRRASGGAGGGGENFVFNFGDFNIGNGMSRDEVAGIVKQFGETLRSEVRTGLSKARRAG